MEVKNRVCVSLAYGTLSKNPVVYRFDQTGLHYPACLWLSSQNGSGNVDSVVTVATRLAEGGHYGADRIAEVSSRLQEDWKSLTTMLEERSNTLAMSTGFHQGAEKVYTYVFIYTYLPI